MLTRAPGRAPLTALLLALAAAACGDASAARSERSSADPLMELARASLARIEGDLRVPGLQQPVEVIRDEWGIPHIYAQNTHDLFFAQGYVTAQDRL